LGLLPGLKEVVALTGSNAKAMIVDEFSESKCGREAAVQTGRIFDEEMLKVDLRSALNRTKTKIYQRGLSVLE